MRLSTYNIIRITIAALLGVSVSFFVVLGNYIFPVIAAIAAFIIIMALRRRVSEVINDERDYYLAGKAARWTVFIFIMIAALGSMVFMALRKGNPFFERLGYASAYIACFVMVLQSILFYIFEKKDHGEK